MKRLRYLGYSVGRESTRSGSIRYNEREFETDEVGLKWTRSQ